MIYFRQNHWKRISGKYSFDYEDDFWIKTYGYELTDEQQYFLTFSNGIYNSLCPLNDFLKYYKPYSKFEEPGCWTVRGAKHEYLRRHIKQEMYISTIEIAKYIYQQATRSQGITIHAISGDSSINGYAVPDFSKPYKTLPELSENAICDFISQNKEILSDSSVFITVWPEVSKKAWNIAISELYFNETAARIKAKQRNAKTYFEKIITESRMKQKTL